MIVVVGAGRSGTSMWMQVLAAAGFTVIGEAFPAGWRAQLGSANPRGFFESNLIHGINFTTNPDPVSGVELSVEGTSGHVVKTFSAGLRRTEISWLGRVVVTVREWRTFSDSVQRFSDLASGAVGEGRGPSQGVDPPGYWLSEYLAILRDARTRRYPIRLVAYEDVLADPERVVPPVLEWIGVEADTAAAVRAVEPLLSTPTVGGARPRAPHPLSEPLDDFYAALSGRAPLDDRLIRHLTEVHRSYLQSGVGRQR